MTQAQRITLYILVLIASAAWITISAEPTAVSTTGKTPAPQAGFPAPDFTLRTPTGEIYTRSELKGQAVFGAIASAAIVLFIYRQRKNLELWSTLDALTPFFALLAIGLGLSHLAAGTSFGKETELPWGIELWNATRHPTQIYAFLASLITFGLLWLKKQGPRPGILFLTFAALTSLSQLFIEAFRADNPVIANGFKQNQIVAWIVLALTFLLMELRIRQSKKRD